MNNDNNNSNSSENKGVVFENKDDPVNESRVPRLTDSEVSIQDKTKTTNQQTRSTSPFFTLYEPPVEEVADEKSQKIKYGTLPKKSEVKKDPSFKNVIESEDVELEDYITAKLKGRLQTFTKDQAVKSINKKYWYINKILEGEAFDGGLPILDQNIDEFKKLYGKKFGQRKGREIYKLNDKLTVFFENPKDLRSSYEFAFMKEYSGRGGLPKFKGAVLNGYQVEELSGKTLTTLIKEKTGNFKPGTPEYNSALKEIFTKDFSQKLLNSVSSFHTETGLSHGNLQENPDDILITNDGNVRIIGKDWSSGQDITTEEEITSLKNYLTDDLGVKDLTLPATINGNTYKTNRKNFLDFANRQVKKDQQKPDQIETFATPRVSISFTSDGWYVNRKPILPPSSRSIGDKPSFPTGQTKFDDFSKKARRKEIISKTSGKAFGAMGTAIGGPIGGFVSNKVGKYVGSFVSDPIGTIKGSVRKFVAFSAGVAAAFAGFLVTVAIEWIVYILLLIVFTIFVVFIINTGAYVVPPGSIVGQQLPPSGPCPETWPVESGTITQGAYVAPMSCTCCDDFGNCRICDCSHTNMEALDIGGIDLVPVYATHDGVAHVSFSTCIGNNIHLVSTCTVGSTTYEYWSEYAHLAGVSISDGQVVSGGQQIGISGNTGTCTTGPHLHYRFQYTNLSNPRYESNLPPYMMRPYLPRDVVRGCLGTPCGNIP
jgi:hypothetical protein